MTSSYMWHHIHYRTTTSKSAATCVFKNRALSRVQCSSHHTFQIQCSFAGLISECRALFLVYSICTGLFSEYSARLIICLNTALFRRACTYIEYTVYMFQIYSALSHLSNLQCSSVYFKLTVLFRRATCFQYTVLFRRACICIYDIQCICFKFIMLFRMFQICNALS